MGERLGIGRVDTYHTLAREVYNRIKEMIISGRFQPGQRLVAQQIAEEMGVSRMPVREALKRLEAQGFVYSVPHKEVVVSGLSVKDIEEIYAIRRVLEVYSVRQACELATEEQLAELERIADEAEMAVALEGQAAFHEKNDEFHFALFRASGNETLAELLKSLWEKSAYYRTLGTALKGRLDQSMADHRAIIRALRENDPDTAAELVRRHTDAPLAALIELLKEKQGATREHVSRSIGNSAATS